MAREELRFRTALFGYRKYDVIRCVKNLQAVGDAERRLAQEKFSALERRMALVEQENSALRQNLAQHNAVETIAAANAERAESEVEVLTRKLAAAQAEIRRYQTQLFAYERAMLSLRRENAEMEELCEQARERGVSLKQKQELPHFEAIEEEPRRAVAERVETPRCTQAPAARPADSQTPANKSELEDLSLQLLDEMERLMEQEGIPLH